LRFDRLRASRTNHCVRPVGGPPGKTERSGSHGHEGRRLAALFQAEYRSNGLFAFLGLRARTDAADDSGTLGVMMQHQSVAGARATSRAIRRTPSRLRFEGAEVRPGSRCARFGVGARARLASARVNFGSARAAMVGDRAPASSSYRELASRWRQVWEAGQARCSWSYVRSMSRGRS